MAATTASLITIPARELRIGDIHANAAGVWARQTMCPTGIEHEGMVVAEVPGGYVGEIPADEPLQVLRVDDANPADLSPYYAIALRPNGTALGMTVPVNLTGDYMRPAGPRTGRHWLHADDSYYLGNGAWLSTCTAGTACAYPSRADNDRATAILADLIVMRVYNDMPTIVGDAYLTNDAEGLTRFDRATLAEMGIRCPR